MKKSISTWLFLIFIFLIPLVAFAAYKYYENRFLALPVFGGSKIENGKKEDHRVPTFELTNQEGVIVKGEEWKNRVVVADFFFTHCPSICPKMTKSLKKVQYAVGTDNVFISSFSVDPERDSAAQLSWYTRRFAINTDNWQLLTGKKTDIYRLARNGFMIVATDGDGGPNDFIHSEKLVLIDKQRRIRGYYSGTSDKEVTQLIHDIKKLNHED